MSLLLTLGGGNRRRTPTAAPPPDPFLPASITVSPTAATLAPGATRQFTALVRNAAGEDITASVSVAWSSATPAAVTITAGGLATAVADGSSIITATAGSVSATSPVTVATPSATPLVDLSGEGDATTVRALQVILGPVLSAYSEDTPAKNKYWDRQRDGIDERLTLLESAGTRMWPTSGGKTITLVQGSSDVVTNWDVTGLANFIMIEAGPLEREYAYLVGTGPNTATIHYPNYAAYSGSAAPLWPWPHAGTTATIRLYAGEVANNDLYSANYYQSLASAYGLGYALRDRARRDNDTALLAESEALLTRIDGAVDLFARWHGFFEGRFIGSALAPDGWVIDAKAFDHPGLSIRCLRGRPEWREALIVAGQAYNYVAHRDRNAPAFGAHGEMRNPGFGLEMAAGGAAMDTDATRKATAVQRAMDTVSFFRNQMGTDPKGRWNTVNSIYWTHDDPAAELPDRVNQPFTTAHAFGGLGALWRLINSEPALVTQYAGTGPGTLDYLEETYLLAARQLIPAWLGPAGTWPQAVMRGMRYYEREGMRYQNISDPPNFNGTPVNDYSGDISGGGFYSSATPFTDHAFATLRTILVMQASSAAFAYQLSVRRGAPVETYREIAEDAMDASFAWELGDGKRGAWEPQSFYSNPENKRWGQSFLRTRTIYANLRGHLGY